jgi:rhodanese-related sulfurtransferase
MTADELQRRIEAGDAPAILDVRSRREFTQGHVPGAQFVPFWAVMFLAWAVKGKRDEPLIVYCGHGPRAMMARPGLLRRGFRDIQYLDGHWSAWARDGRPVER